MPRPAAPVSKILELIHTFKSEHVGGVVPLKSLLEESGYSTELEDLHFGISSTEESADSLWTVDERRPRNSPPISEEDNMLLTKLGLDRDAIDGHMIADWPFDAIEELDLYAELQGSPEYLSEADAKMRIEKARLDLLERIQKTVVLRRSELLQDIDFSGLAISQCDFSGCDLTGSKFAANTLRECTFKQTVLDETNMEDVSFEDCEFEQTSFDYASMKTVKFELSEASQTSHLHQVQFNYLAEGSTGILFQVASADKLSEVSILGGSADTITVQRHPDATIEEINVKDITTSHPVNVGEHIFYEASADRPRVLLPWNNHEPGVAAKLTRIQIQRDDLGLDSPLNVVPFDYLPKGVSLIALEGEVDALNQLIKERREGLKAELTANLKDFFLLSEAEKDRLDELGYYTNDPINDHHSQWQAPEDPTECPLYKKLVPIYGRERAKVQVIAALKQFQQDVIDKLDERRADKAERQWQQQAESFTMMMFSEMRENPEDYPEMARLYQHAKTAYDACDSIMLPGGADLDPRLYGEDTGTTTKPRKSPKDASQIDLRRDILDYSLLYLQARKRQPKPLFAICRGAQATAAFYGGKIIQELDSPERLRLFIEDVEAERFIPPPSPSDRPHSPAISLSKISEASESASEHGIIKFLFTHHQGFQLVPRETGLMAVATTTTSSGKDIVIAAENLSQSISIIQPHPEYAGISVGGDPVSQRLAQQYFSSLATMTDGSARHSRSALRDLRTLFTKTGNIEFVDPSHGKESAPITRKDLEAFTRPDTHADAVPLRGGKTYETVVVGMGPVGLVDILCAIQRDEKPVAILTDRPISELGVRQQVLGVDEVMTWVASGIVRQGIIDRYIELGQITEEKYDGESYWYFSTGALERLLIEELKAAILDKELALLDDMGFFDGLELYHHERGEWLTIEQADSPKAFYELLRPTRLSPIEEVQQRYKEQMDTLCGDTEETRAEVLASLRGRIGIDIIQVDKIPPQISSEVDLTKGTGIRLSDNPDSLLRPSLIKQKRMREHIDVQHKHLTLGKVVAINEAGLSETQAVQLKFKDIVAANGAKQQTERALSGKLESHDVHTTQPLHKDHVATIFAINKHAPVAWDPSKEAPVPEQMTYRRLSKMTAYCKKHPSETTPVKLSELERFGWDVASRPHQQVYTTASDEIGAEEQDYCYIGCEYPIAITPPGITKAIDYYIAKIQQLLERHPQVAIGGATADFQARVPEAIREHIEVFFKFEAIAKAKRPRDLALHLDQVKAFRADRSNISRMSKDITRKWCRLLLRDALPRSVCSEMHLQDPDYRTEEEVEADEARRQRDKKKKFLSTSQFKLGFSELTNSIVPLSSCLFGGSFAHSHGDGRMFPLYTTGTGAQTGLKLAREFHKMKKRMHRKLRNLKEHGTVTFKQNSPFFAVRLFQRLGDAAGVDIGSRLTRDDAFEFLPPHIGSLDSHGIAEFRRHHVARENWAAFDAEVERYKASYISENQGFTMLPDGIELMDRESLAAYREEMVGEAGFDPEVFDAEVQRYIEAYDNIARQCYGQYHANVRTIIDEIREVQAEWIEARNSRFVKAERVRETISDAMDIIHRMDGISTAFSECVDTCSLKRATVPSPGGALFHRQASIGRTISETFKTAFNEEHTREHINKIASTINKLSREFVRVKSSLDQYAKYSHSGNVVAYESIPARELHLSESEATIDKYYEALRQACASIHTLSQEAAELQVEAEFLLRQPEISPHGTPLSESFEDSPQAIVGKAIKQILEGSRQMHDLLNCDLFKSHLPTGPSDTAHVVLTSS